MSKTIKFPSVKPATAEEWVKGRTAIDREGPAPALEYRGPAARPPSEPAN